MVDETATSRTQSKPDKAAPNKIKPKKSNGFGVFASSVGKCFLMNHMPARPMGMFIKKISAEEHSS